MILLVLIAGITGICTIHSLHLPSIDRASYVSFRLGNVLVCTKPVSDVTVCCCCVTICPRVILNSCELIANILTQDFLDSEQGVTFSYSVSDVSSYVGTLYRAYEHMHTCTRAHTHTLYSTHPYKLGCTNSGICIGIPAIFNGIETSQVCYTSTNSVVCTLLTMK